MSSSSSPPPSSSSASLYVVTAQKPTAVSYAVVGNFTNPNVLNLMLGKCNRIELYCVVDDGIQAVYDVNIYGRISIMKLFRPPSHDRDQLFVVTDRMSFFVLSYDEANKRLVTVATGDLATKLGKTCEKPLGLIDKQSRMIATRLYDGYIQMIPIHNNGHLHTEAISIRLNELQILHMCFLYDETTPSSLLVLYQDSKEARHMKMYQVDVREKELRESTFHRLNLNFGANMLVPVELPFGGVIVTSETTISYYKTDVNSSNAPSYTVHVDPTVFATYARVDKYRFLFADIGGNLYVIVLKHDGKTVQGIDIEPLGVTCIANAITYLDNGYVYVGSTKSNSMLLHLSTERLPNGYMFEVIDEFNNLGPIQDMTVIDMDREGQGQVVTCSGVYHNGSLRVLRNGIAINEEACVDMEGIKGLWSLKESSFASAYHKYLVHAFVSETRILGISDEGLEEIDECGFNINTQTLFCGNLSNNIMIQVTPTCIYLISCETLECVHTWQPTTTDHRITLGYAVDASGLISIGNGVLILLRMNDNELVEITRTTLDYEIACVDISSANNTYASVGLWKDMSILLIELPSLTVKFKHKLIDDTIPRSLKFAVFDNISYLLCGLGDGHLYSFIINENTFELTQPNKVALGSQPVLLSTFQQSSSSSHDNHNELDLFHDDNNDVEMKDLDEQPRLIEHVFASCDRPTIIYTNERNAGKLMFSNVNLKDISHMCMFNTEISEGSLALATTTSLIIGNIDDEIQRLHIQTIRLNEQPRRITHQPLTNTFLLGSVKMGTGLNANEAISHEHITGEPISRPIDVSAMMNISLEEHFLRLLNDQTFDRLDSQKLDDYENVCCIISANFTIFDHNDDGDDDMKTPASVDDMMDIVDNGDMNEYYVVGTAIANPEEPEAKSGRILVYKVVDQKLELIHATTVNGAVYRVREFNGKLLAGISCVLNLYKFTRMQNNTLQLRKEAHHHGHIVIIDMKVNGDFILVGDMIKSVMVIVYKRVTGKLEEIARDFNTNWMTAVEMLDNDTYLGADSSCNIFVTQRNMTAVTEEERCRLLLSSSYHLGEFVNVFHKGSLVMNVRENEKSIVPKLLGCTISGAVIVIAVLNKQQYMFLHRLQQQLQALIIGVGGLKHELYRGFYRDRNPDMNALNVIDGDLIEQFLELPFDKQENISKALGMEYNDVISFVQDAARIH